MARSVLFAFTTAVTLLLVASAAAVPPTRTTFQVDETFQSLFLTNACGIPVWVHVEGAGTTTLFYDQSGILVRELDMFANGLASTYYSPLQIGGTGKSFTDVLRSPALFLYPEGVDIGDAAVVMFVGAIRTAGRGGPRNVGRVVYEAEIVDIGADGVPVVDIGAPISQAGQFDTAAVVEARCALLTDP